MFVRSNNIVQIINIDFWGGAFESGQNAMFIKGLFTFQFLPCGFHLFDATNRFVLLRPVVVFDTLVMMCTFHFTVDTAHR